MRQQPPSHYDKDQAGVYAFDLKLNVDFNTRHLSLNIPNQVPFSKKGYVPIAQCPPGPVYQHIPQYIPISNEQTMQNMHPNIPRPQVMQINQYHQMHSESLQNVKNFESMNTTSFRMEQSPNAIQCVICEKVISNQHFALHLEEHRNKKKDKSRSSIRESEVSIREKNSEAEMAQIAQNNLQSISLIPNSLNFSQSNMVSQTPRMNLQEASQQTLKYHNELTPVNFPYDLHHSQSERIYYQPSQQSNFSQTSFNLSQSMSRPIHAANGSFSSSSHSYIPIPTNDPGLHSVSQSQRQIIIHQIHPSNMPPERDMNTFHLHKIQSMIIRPEPVRVQRALDECGQSNISRNSVPTRYSQIQAIEHMLTQKRPTFSQQDSSSSDDESIKVYPSKSYRSGIAPAETAMQRSTYTQKLQRTKLPVNYLAREEFITTSTHNTNSRNSKGLP